MTGSTCSSARCEAHRQAIGLSLIAVSCGLAYLAYSLTAWFWIPCALMGWYGTYQILSSKGCGRRRDATDGKGSANDQVLTATQRTRRRRMGHHFLAGAVTLALISAGILPALWPLTVIAGWFATSFYVAAHTGYVGCPEVGAIPSWLLGRRITTRCAPLERMDSRPN